MAQYHDSGDYTWPVQIEGFDRGGALVDVPKPAQYDTLTCAQRHDAMLAELQAQVDELRRHVAIVERKLAQWEADS